MQAPSWNLQVYDFPEREVLQGKAATTEGENRQTFLDSFCLDCP